MAEELVITDPIEHPTPPAPPPTTKYKVVSLTMDVETPPVPAPEPGLLIIKVRDNNGIAITVQYLGAEAMTFIKYMNTANFSTTSMQKRILQKLSNEGYLPPGTVSGVPDGVVLEVSDATQKRVQPKNDQSEHST
jgi:hypothetical protein